MKILHALKLSVGTFGLLSDTTSVNDVARVDTCIANWIKNKRSCLHVNLQSITAETHSGRHWVKYALVDYKIADSILMSLRSVQGGGCQLEVVSVSNMQFDSR